MPKQTMISLASDFDYFILFLLLLSLLVTPVSPQQSMQLTV